MCVLNDHRKEVGVKKEIAKITDSFLGWEDHGIFTATLFVDYGGTSQGIGNYCLVTKAGGEANGMKFIMSLMSACGVSSWEKILGKTIFVLSDNNGRVIGVENLPTERGNLFIFADAFAETEMAS